MGFDVNNIQDWLEKGTINLNDYELISQFIEQYTKVTKEINELQKNKEFLENVMNYAKENSNKNKPICDEIIKQLHENKKKNESSGIENGHAKSLTSTPGYQPYDFNNFGKWNAYLIIVITIIIGIALALLALYIK